MKEFLIMTLALSKSLDFYIKIYLMQYYIDHLLFYLVRVHFSQDIFLSSKDNKFFLEIIFEKYVTFQK